MEEGKKLNLNEILDKHKKWLLDEDGGERADLRDADLRNADLSNAILCNADLSNAILCNAGLCSARLYGADLSSANLYSAILCNADLRNANLSSARLYDADLSSANLCSANLCNAILCNAKLNDVKANVFTTGYWPVCPEEGTFIGYKKARGYIVKLRIPETAKRSSATTRKCRCSEAEVLAITDAAGMAWDAVASKYDPDFVYRVGKTVTVPNFDDNRWNECSTGIHFFITRKEAEVWTG